MIRPYSKRREAQLREYNSIRYDFLAGHPYCERCQIREATQVHHKKGRTGQLLTAEEYFMAVCADCHSFIELHPQQARDAGWSLSRLAKTIKPHTIMAEIYVLGNGYVSLTRPKDWPIK